MKADVLDALYAVAPEEFVATRTALAKAARAAGDRDSAQAISALRKPTVAAWALNALVLERPVDIEAFVEFAARLRQAQSTLDARAMRDLREEREAVLGAVLTGVEFVAERHERPLTPAVVDEVRMTLVAALADEAAQQAVFSGHLVRPLTYAGFGEVDLDDAVAAEVLTASAQRAADAARAERTRASQTPEAGRTPEGGESGGVSEIPDRGDKPEAAPRPAPADPPAEALSAERPQTPAIASASSSAPEAVPQPARRTRKHAEQRDAAKRARANLLRAQQNARERERLERAVQEVEHALAQASLQHAECTRLAQRATARADELQALLTQARREAQDAQAAAEAAETERAQSARKLQRLRTQLEAVDSPS
ncbi:hypothetical protein [Gephyromycinifex aptenodytis]|uniref:hypothetical protein n=1 Tax=Gephyromycinifex aptenodytis TaxID=2716227 RepID=UPI0014470923|nr:hypothetical protein [Gephyromycinifex aptenodytis]